MTLPLAHSLALSLHSTLTALIAFSYRFWQVSMRAFQRGAVGRVVCQFCLKIAQKSSTPVSLDPLPRPRAVYYLQASFCLRLRQPQK